MSFMKPTKSSQQRNDEKKKVIKQGVAQQEPNRVTIDRQKISSGRASFELGSGRESFKLDEQTTKFLDTETTPELRLSEFQATRNSLPIQRSQTGSLQTQLKKDSLQQSQGQKNLKQQMVQPLTPRMSTSKKTMEQDAQKALSLRLSQPKTYEKRQQNTSMGQTSSDQMSLSNKKKVQLSGRDSVINATTKSQMMRLQAISNEKQDKQGRNSFCLNSSLKSSLKSNQMQSSMKLSQNLRKSISNQNVQDQNNNPSNRAAHTKSALEIQLEKIKQKTNQLYFKNSKNRSSTSMLERKPPSTAIATSNTKIATNALTARKNSNHSRTSSYKRRQQDLQQTFGRKRFVKQPSPAQKNISEGHTSLFRNSKEDINDIQRCERQIETPQLSLIHDRKPDNKDGDATVQTETEPFEESNFFKTNFDEDDIGLVIEGSTILNNDQNSETVILSQKGDNQYSNFDINDLSQLNNQEETSSKNEGKPDGPMHGRQLSMMDLDKNPFHDSIMQVQGSQEVNNVQSPDSQVFKYNGLNQGNADVQENETQITAFLGNSGLNQDSSLNNSDSFMNKLDFKRRQSTILNIQIDEVDSDKENDNSFFNDQSNCDQSKHSNISQRKGRNKPDPADKPNQKHQMKKEKAINDSIFETGQVDDGLAFDESDKDKKSSDSINTIAVVEESSENESRRSQSQCKDEKGKQLSIQKRQQSSDFDILTADFEVQSLNNRQERNVVMAGSFAHFANGSIVDNQDNININDKQNSSEDSPINSLKFSHHRNNSLKRPAQRVDFSFQSDGSPERSIKIINTLSSSKQNNENSQPKSGRGSVKQFNTNLFVVQEMSEGMPTPQGQKKMNIQQKNYISEDQNKILEQKLKQMQPIKQILEVDDEDKSPNSIQTPRKLSFDSNSNQEKLADDKQKKQVALPLIFNQKNQQSQQDHLTRYGNGLKPNMLEQTASKQISKPLELAPASVDAETKQRDSAKFESNMNEKQRMSLQEKIQLRKQKLKQEEKMKQITINLPQEPQNEEYFSPSFKMSQSQIRQPHFFQFMEEIDNQSKEEKQSQKKTSEPQSTNRKRDTSPQKGSEPSAAAATIFTSIHQIKQQKNKQKKFSMESIKMNNIVNQNQIKNISMHLEEKQLLDQTNPCDDSQNMNSKAMNASNNGTLQGINQYQSLAKFVDDQLVNKDKKRASQISAKNQQNIQKLKQNNIRVSTQDQSNNDHSANESLHDAELKLSYKESTHTPQKSLGYYQTPKSSVNLSHFAQKQKQTQGVSEKLSMYSRNMNIRPSDNQFDKTSQFDDAKSNYSKISKVSKFTNNLMNKSNNMINDQWYQFIYNYDDQCLDDEDDETISMTRSQGGISRFTLNSKLSNAGQSNLSKISKLQNKYLHKNKQFSSRNDNIENKDPNRRASTNAQTDQAQSKGDRTPLQKLNDLLTTIDICRLIRLNWLLGPIINRRTVKSRLFNFLNYQVQLIIQDLDCQIKQAICYYMSDDLMDCMQICKQCRLLYLEQYKKNRKQTKYDSYQMVKVWVIELTCHIELMHEDQKSNTEKEQLRQQAHEILEQIPTVVKRRQNQHFTIIELLLQYKEKIAYSKLKDLDFISYKLFKLERAISLDNDATQKGQARDDISQLFMKEDDDEKKSPQEYCEEIQKQFNRIPTSEQIKKIEYYMYGALCAYRNYHYKEAWNFVSQAPFICNFGEQVPDLETLVVFEMLKMVELKLLTKIGRPEQAIIQISNRFFQNKIIDDDQFNKLFPFSASQQNTLSFDTHIFMDQTWYLYKKIQYTCRLIEFKQEQLKFKMISCIGQDFNVDASALQKANDDLYNQMYHLLHIMKSLQFYERKQQFRNRVLQFHWLIIKLLLRLEKSGKFQQMISNENFIGIFQRLDIIEVIKNLKQEWQSGTLGGLPDGQIQQLSKAKNKKMIDHFIAKYGSQPLIKTIQSLQNRLNQKFNKAGQSNNYNQKKQAYKKKQQQNKKKFDDSHLDLSQLDNDNDIFGKSLLDKSEIIQANYSNPSIHIEPESEMMNKIMKCPQQFFIQLQYITDFVDKKMADVNYLAFKDHVSQQEDFSNQMISDHQQPQSPSVAPINNYFEQLKTDKYQKQTKFIAGALTAFLKSAKMIVFQNLHTVQDLLDHEIKRANNLVENQQPSKVSNTKSKQLQSKFLEKSKHVLRALETIYINEEFIKLNMDNDQTLNDLDKNPYISDDKSCITGLNGLSVIQNNQGILNTSQDSHTVDYSYIDNLTNLNFAGQFQEKDNISAQNFMSNGLNFNNLRNQNLRTDITEDYSQVSNSEYQNISRFEGGEPEEDEPTTPPPNQRAVRYQNQSSQRASYRSNPQSNFNGRSSHSKERQKQKSYFRKMKVQYFNMDATQNQNFLDPSSAVITTDDKGITQAIENNPDKLQQKHDMIQKEISYDNMDINQLKIQARDTDQQVKDEEEDFMIELNKSIDEENKHNRKSRSSSQNRESSKSSQGDKIVNNDDEKDCHKTAKKHNKKYSDSFKKESSGAKEGGQQDFHFQSPQMSDLIDKLQFGGPNNYENDDAVNTPLANKNGRLTFPLHLMQSNNKQNNESYFDLEKNDPGINNGPNEIEQFFDQTSRIAPSQINFNDLDLDVNDNHDESRLSDLNSEDEQSDDDDDQNLSIDDLIHNQQEKLNYTILNHSIYNEESLFKLVMACCLADDHLNLGIRIINILLKIRTQQTLLKTSKSVFMNYLEIITAYIYLRLNQKQFQKQQSNLNTSKILEQTQNISRIHDQNQNTPNRLFADISALRIQDISRDDTSQINYYNNSSTIYGQDGMNNLIETMNSINYGQTINGITATDISQGQISQHMVAPCHAALKQQIMCIIQNQDYFVQQARLQWKKFDADSFLINLAIPTLEDDKNTEEEQYNTLVTTNIITMMLIYVQNELLTYKQIRPYDNMYEVSDIKLVQLPQQASSYRICITKLSQEAKNQRMFTAFKKIEKRDNVLRKSDNRSTDLEGQPQQIPVKQEIMNSDSAQKQPQQQAPPPPQPSCNMQAKTQDQLQKKQQMLCKDYNLFKKELLASTRKDSPPTTSKLHHAPSGMRATADFGLKNLLNIEQLDQKDKRHTLNDLCLPDNISDDMPLRMQKQ